MEIDATNVVAIRPPNGDRLQRRALLPIDFLIQALLIWEKVTLKIQNGRQGPQNGRRVLERGLTLGYWPFGTTLAK